ncbi:cytochrome P450 [Streptomyces peucetius]|uniref:Cytochrome P450 n=1 Tax=Streptomyces peucetius TaxID=1950 RepID=A0ABY6IFA2_STRPE|nr:cytochrome P450 [Streptomyces peucetius]UYQ65690.1 cytochrome P450 [Streptomyces peucetius]
MTGRSSLPSSDRHGGGGSGDAVCPVTAGGGPDGPRTKGAGAAGAAQPAGGRPAHREPGRARARGTGHARARRRDRRVYLRAHPLLFALLAATRGRPVRRIGRTVLVHEADACREVLTRLPLDRTAPGTTGGAARSALGARKAKGTLNTGNTGDAGVLFDQDGDAHRALRRTLARDLGTAGVDELRALWRPLIAHRLEPLAAGGTVDVVALARELAGTVVRALLGSAAAPQAVAAAAAEVAALSVRGELPGLPRPGARAAVARATARLRHLLGDGDNRGDEALSAMVAVAAVNTTVAALPRAAAWCADAGLWEQAADDTLRRSLAGELLRVTAASPLLPRVAAADGVAGGCPVRSGDRLLLVARHAVGAHASGPDALRPAPPGVARLVFGAGPHTCPGAGLAGALLEDLLAALAPYRPAVVRARADRRAALPGWRTLTLRATAGRGQR